jgi:16S rRNA (adenine1518-N6/adenine1519-N6)-dimethyltransferase
VTFYSPLASPRATIDRLTEWGLSTHKSLGQHFLIDDGVVGRILRLAEIEPGDGVLEVGPGIGTLTEALLIAGARVIAIEKDDKLLPVLAELSSRYPDDFTLIHADALDATTHWDPVPVCCCPGKLVANLPYAVAATIVLDYFESIPSLRSATVMVQKEVADRMAARPGTKDYGAYTVKLALFAQPTASFGVSRTNFLPPPRVDSTVIRLDRRDDRPGDGLLKATFTVIEAAFAERRKTIRNSMRSYFSAQRIDPEQVDTLLGVANIPTTIRGETLTVEEFLALGEVFDSLG